MGWLLAVCRYSQRYSHDTVLLLVQDLWFDTQDQENKINQENQNKTTKNNLTDFHNI